MNLLPMRDFITVDIGGGSTELVLVKDRRIVHSLSFDMGAVRLKSAFGDIDDEAVLQAIKAEIKSFIDKIPNTYYGCSLVAIGGTARNIAKSIFRRHNAIGSIHGFEFDTPTFRETYEAISSGDEEDLIAMKIGKERVPFIKYGL